MDEKGERWEKYKDSITRAKRSYLSKKKSISLILEPEEHAEIKAYCEARVISMQGFIRDCALERVRS